MCVKSLDYTQICSVGFSPIARPKERTATVLEKIDKWVYKLAKYVAVLGGLVLVAVAIMTTISIIGRAFIFAGLRPIRGDFELVEAGIAFAVFAFMPWCHLKKGHASVEVFTTKFPPRVNAAIDMVADVILALVAMLLAWRHYDGMLSKMQYNETTFILRFPSWWAYAICLVGLITWIIVGSWSAFKDARMVLTGHTFASADAGAAK